MKIFSKIVELLEKNQIQYVSKRHAPTLTSLDSARERGEPLKIGAKALLVKTDKVFILAVLPADRRLDTKALRTIIRCKNIRFATAEELAGLTSLVPGAVPPFGNILGIKMLVDNALFNEEYMAFNAGSLEISIKMKTEDYRRVVNPTTDDFSERA